jgi:DNA-binding response OmpR family regulator
MSEETAKPRILVAEDEAPLRNLIQLHLESQGYEVVAAVDGVDALEKFHEEGPWDLVILDIMMPGLDGFTVLQEIRKRSEVPAVFLTALGSGDDIVKGFNIGADDYITKPFTFREVAVRIKAILRRVAWMKLPPSRPTVLRSGDIELKTELRQVIVRGKSCHVTPIEYGLLQYFMTHFDSAVDKNVLFQEVWGYEYEGSTNLVEVGIRRLREKIELDPSKPKYIRTIRGIGYRFNKLEPS